jgi:D-aminoacyl-tRNA deacylase
MRLVVQRVQRAAVRIDEEVVGEIGSGAMVLVGVGSTDDEAVADRMADKLSGLRYFADEEGRANLTIAEAGGSFLVVSQFTLYGDLRRGRRPGFTEAARPEVASTLIDRLVSRLSALGHLVETGRFGAMMDVELVNAGPFTLLLDSDRDL